MQIRVKISHILNQFFFFLIIKTKHKQKEIQKDIPYPQTWMTHCPQCVNRDRYITERVGKDEAKWTPPNLDLHLSWKTKHYSSYVMEIGIMKCMEGVLVNKNN